MPSDVLHAIDWPLGEKRTFSAPCDARALRRDVDAGADGIIRGKPAVTPDMALRLAQVEPPVPARSTRVVADVLL